MNISEVSSSLSGVKPRQRQLISQAWEKHVAERKKTSVTKAHIYDAFETMWTSDMEKYMNETFLANIHLLPPLLSANPQRSRSVDIALVHPCLWRRAGVL